MNLFEHVYDRNNPERTDLGQGGDEDPQGDNEWQFDSIELHMENLISMVAVSTFTLFSFSMKFGTIVTPVSPVGIVTILKNM